MGRVFQPTYTKSDGKGGRVTVKVKSWYCEYTDAAGNQQRPKIGTKRAAESALARFQEEADRLRAGLPNLFGDATARNRPIAEILQEYTTEIEQRGRVPEYVALVTRHVTNIAAACKWHTWADVTDAALIKYLAGLRKVRSPSTCNGHMRSAKSFAIWYADKIDVRSPLRSVRGFNEQVERKRSRRILSDDEFRKLLVTAEAWPSRRNMSCSGPDRAALYRIAAFTGLRSSELGSLTPECFDLASDPPTVTVEAKNTKGKRLEPVPLENSLVAFLTKWLKGRPAGKLLWPGRWAKAKDQSRWLRQDVKRAGLGTGVIFHSLRRQFVTGLIRSGCDVDEVRRLARHKSVKTTLDHYAETGMKQLGKAVNKLKPLI